MSNRTIVFGSFEWDRNKELLNFARHRLSFADAAEAFMDQYRLIVADSGHGDGETRYFCIGVAKGEVATVRFTLWQKRIRIIGAGYWRKWRKEYEKKKESLG